MAACGQDSSAKSSYDITDFECPGNLSTALGPKVTEALIGSVAVNDNGNKTTSLVKITNKASPFEPVVFTTVTGYGGRPLITTEAVKSQPRKWIWQLFPIRQGIDQNVPTGVEAIGWGDVTKTPDGEILTTCNEGKRPETSYLDSAFVAFTNISNRMPSF